MLRALQGKHLIADRASNHQRVDFTHANGAQCLFQLGDARQHCFPFAYFVRSLRSLLHARSYVVCKSKPRTTRSWSEKSPTSRRNGKGIDLTNVGAAMIWPFAARAGC